ncbi:MAG: hypothetical protein ACFFED_17820 [Candidatus Thorarchaeota archaeon]
MKKMRRGVVAIAMVILILSFVKTGQTPETERNVIDTESKGVFVTSETDWSDDFNDEDISDWEVFGLDWSQSPIATAEANFTLTGGVLRAVGSNMSLAVRDSTIGYGTWTFDVDVQKPEGFDRFGVAMMSSWTPEGDSENAYFLSIEKSNETPSGTVRFAKNEEGELTQFLTERTIDNLQGWKHFVVTREQTGQFYVYMNGTLILDVIDTSYTTLEKFGFFAHGNPAIDNVVVVNNTITHDGAPPKFSHSLIDWEIVQGESFYYDINATDYSEIDQWWISDNENFTIDDDGVITNYVSLNIGIYHLDVYVNDTLGNTRTGTFQLTVKGIPIPVELVLGGVGVAGIVIVALVIWRIKKK